MTTNDDNNEVYHNLTESRGGRENQPAKWTLYLMLCCLTASVGSFTFGYNIGVTNLPTPLIKGFMIQRYYNKYYVDRNNFTSEKAKFDSVKGAFNGIKTKLEELGAQLDNTTVAAIKTELNSKIAKLKDEFNKEYADLSLNDATKTIQFLNATENKLNERRDALKDENEKAIDPHITNLWTITTALFVVGGMVGAFTSKYVADFFGRKKGILVHHIFTLIGSILAFIAPLINSPECIMISRFAFGIQGGMTCGLVPTYLSEISPSELRGATGVINQLGITIGILVSQILGFRQLLGTSECWRYLLAIPIIPGAIGVICLLLFFPESPRALLLNNNDEESTRKALQRLRNTTDVSGEIEEMKKESRENKSDEAISIKDLFTITELRWPLITGLVLQLTQQLCGINAIFFYSESIFTKAQIKPDHIQYAVFLTGFINVIMTLVVIPIIDRLGRKPLLVYPMIIIIFDFILLTVFLIFQEKGDILYSYLCIVCIIVFIMCFAVGLGPIPFLYVAECFRQDARSAALAICMFTNWVANLILTLAFPSLAKILGNYVFLVFTAIVTIALAVIFTKVPETKGRSTDEIIAEFSGKKHRYDAESSGKLMPNTKV